MLRKDDYDPDEILRDDFEVADTDDEEDIDELDFEGKSGSHYYDMKEDIDQDREFDVMTG
ncbi:MAG: hypothetical protein GF350_13640 [Chitinivibrionales bacterium]|nr:hypothetical protein [Chitinivibrionales bacterium]